MADRIRVTWLMAAAHAGEEVGWCRFYQSPVAVAMKRLALISAQVTYGEDSKEPGPPVKRRVETHTASAQDSSTPVPWRWRSRAPRIIGSHRTKQLLRCVGPPRCAVVKVCLVLSGASRPRWKKAGKTIRLPSSERSEGTTACG